MTQSFNRLDALKEYAEAEGNATADDDIAEATTTTPDMNLSGDVVINSTPFDADAIVVYIKGEKSKKPE